MIYCFKLIICQAGGFTPASGGWGLYPQTPAIIPPCEFLATPLRGGTKNFESDRKELGINVEKH